MFQTICEGMSTHDASNKKLPSQCILELQCVTFPFLQSLAKIRKKQRFSALILNFLQTLQRMQRNSISPCVHGRCPPRLVFFMEAQTKRPQQIVLEVRLWEIQRDENISHLKESSLSIRRNQLFKKHIARSETTLAGRYRVGKRGGAHSESLAY